MFDIGFSELLLVAFIALLVIGPERLPRVAYKAGQWIARIQKYIQNARSDIEREIRAEELRQIIEAQGSEMTDLKKSVNELKQELAMREMIDDVKEHNRRSHQKTKKSIERDPDDEKP